MESYPNEFTAHHVPLLFLAGLGPPEALPPDPRDPFDRLVQDLRRLFTSASPRSFALWDTTRGAHHDFRVALVQKTVRFPPLKARPTSERPAAPLHSPISPLSPSSPLFPDGIIAPIWIRKHREMVPAVFLLALRLFEFVPPPDAVAGPLEGTHLALREEQERQHDAELVREIVERRRTTVERGIKLAVVLLSSRTLLDSPTLDARLSQIRRQSTLDSRASLFVISPVETIEVQHFITSLRLELWDSVMDYYREHGRRVRRKRARALGGKGGLGEKGWAVRYDYKMGFMAEMRGEIEVSLKHYEDSYDTLLDMFAQSTLLAPRTKRWAEAKVLADCLTVKISKFYLYLNESSRAVAQLCRHIALFRKMSETWGIGEETFEFWSWLSKQYRLFAELVSLAVRSGFRLPVLRPPPQPRSVPAGATAPNLAGLLPENVLQHAGYYFYLSATCTVQRRNRFRAVSVEGIEGAPIPPAIAHESKVNHAEIIIDLYTKAYEYFKLYKSSRMSLFMASQIALAHYEAGNYETASKFQARIASTYRREGWTSILQPIVRLMGNSAVEEGVYEAALRSSFELLAPASDLSPPEREVCCAQLLHVLRTTPCPTTSSVTIDTSGSASSQLFETHVAFERARCSIGESIAFQISIASPAMARASSLNFKTMTIRFNGEIAPLVVRNQAVDVGSGVELYELVNGQESFSPLRWTDGSTKVFFGTVLATKEVDLTVVSITLGLNEGDWNLELPLRHHLEQSRKSRWYALHANDVVSFFLERVDASLCEVRPHELQVDVRIEHSLPSYIDEEFPIHVEIVNNDRVPISLLLDALLQPGNDQAENLIMIDDQTSSSMIESVSLGALAPGDSLRKALRLRSIGAVGERQIDLSFHIVPTFPTSLGATLPLSAIASSAEILRTVKIHAISPFFSAFEVNHYQRRRAIQPLMDLAAPTGWESSSDVGLTAKLASCGPWEVEILAIKLSIAEGAQQIVRVTDSSLDGRESSFPMRWSPQDAFNILYRLDVAPAASVDLVISPTSTGDLVISWRRRAETTISTTRIPLPSLDPFPLAPSISLRLPTFLTLHTPVTLSYRFSNPTSRLLNLSTQIDSSEGFVFSGPRKLASVILAPDEERLITLVVIPLVVGSCTLPRLRVFDHRRSEELSQSEEETGELATAGRIVRELAVQVETESEKSSTQEDASRGVGAVSSASLVVLVLPR